MDAETVFSYPEYVWTTYHFALSAILCEDIDQGLHHRLGGAVEAPEDDRAQNDHDDGHGCALHRLLRGGPDDLLQLTLHLAKPFGHALEKAGLGGVDCEICHNTGTVIRKDENGIEWARECVCMKARRSKRSLNESGLADLVTRYTFLTYQT
mgnify:CR=1 FL=1